MTLKYEKRDKVALISLDRPAVMNAINLDLARHLSQAWNDFQDDNTLRVLIITGQGDRAFCVGADLKERSQIGQDFHGSSYRDDIFKLPMQDTGCLKPVIAAINGHCLGGGMELALVADIRIASENATFGQPEINWGIFPGMGATQRLPRVLPYNLAAEMLLTGISIDAQRAFEMGLINYLVPHAELMNTALAMAEKIAAKASLALKSAKKALLRSYDLPLDQGLRMEAVLRRIVGDSEDAREGLQAFQGTRPPTYRSD